MLKLHVATETRMPFGWYKLAHIGRWGGSVIVRTTVGPLLACWHRITSSQLKLTRLRRGAGKLGHHQQLPSDAQPAASQNMRCAQAKIYSKSCFNYCLLDCFSEAEVTSETQSSSRST